MYYNPLFLQTPSVQEAAFYQTDLGKLYKSIPFRELAAGIGSPDWEQSGRGRKPFLKVEGGIALMILLVFSALLFFQAKQLGWIGKRHKEEAPSTPVAAK